LKLFRDWFSFIPGGRLIAISCKAWAKNINHETMDRMGLAHFELMID